MLLALLISLASTTAFAADAPAPSNSWGLKIVEYSRCSLPPSNMVMTLEPDGGATLSVLGGFEPGEGSSTRQTKQFTQLEMRKLAKIVRRSKIDSIPNKAYDPLKPPTKTDGCDQSIEIRLDGKTKKIEYNTGYDLPPKLEKFLKNLHVILDRRDWAEDH